MASLFSELVEGATEPGAAIVLNSGDVGLLGSLEQLSAADASRQVNDGATIAAHVQHVRHGLLLMNRWAREGGDPLADGSWDDAWRIAAVSSGEWEEIRRGLRHEALGWVAALATRRPANPAELKWLLGSVAHLAYHLGAIRQIDRRTRGPRIGTFTPSRSASPASPESEG
ncbi:MAG: hypothetical protein ACT4P7_11795 [Gemmatimonadaceae bacterium]